MLTVSLDAAQFISQADDAGRRQVPFAMMKALNATTIDAQKAEQAVVEHDFTLRRRDYILRTVKIERGNFATKDNLRSIINIDAQRDVLAKFEEGGDKTPSAGGKSIALPITVKRSKTDIIQKSQRPRAFNFTSAFTSTRSRMTIYRGDRRTFLIQRPDGFGLILQRVGSALLGPFKAGTRGSTRAGRSFGLDPNLRVLYALVAKTHIPRSLHFRKTIHNSVLSTWPGNFEKWFLEAMRTKK